VVTREPKTEERIRARTDPWALYLLFGLPSRSGLRFHVIRIRCQRRSGQPRKHGHQPDESVCGEQAQRQALLPRVEFGSDGYPRSASATSMCSGRGTARVGVFGGASGLHLCSASRHPPVLHWDSEQSREFNCIDDVRMPTCRCRRRLNTGHFSPAETWTRPRGATALRTEEDLLARGPFRARDRIDVGLRPEGAGDRGTAASPSGRLRGRDHDPEGASCQGAPRPFLAARTFQRTSYLPGEISQIDWWHTGRRVPVGKEAHREAFGLVATLPHSAAHAAVFTFGRTIGDLLPAAFGCFERLGGAPEKVVCDNDTAIVAERRGRVAILHDEIAAFFGRLGTRVVVLRAGDLQAKGRSSGPTATWNARSCRCGSSRICSTCSPSTMPRLRTPAVISSNAPPQEDISEGWWIQP
jgi:hypothetical protein